MPELTEFAGLPVVEFPASGTTEERLERIRERGGDPHAPASVAWRLRTHEGDGYPHAEDRCGEHVARFLSVVDTEQVGALVLGAWGYPTEGGPEEFLESLIEHADKLPNLRSVFVGDIELEESELSWISHGDLAPFVAAFPRLEKLSVKGAVGMEGELELHVPEHASLRSLMLETGGLPGRVVREVVSSGLPALEHLELWLGVEEYGGDSSASDLAPVLSGEGFPRLRYLGVRNAEKVDAWIPVLAEAPVVRRLEVLDLSLGCLTDEGGRVLVDRAEAFSGLRGLDLHHHYLGEEMEGRVRVAFAGTGVEVDLSERLEPSYHSWSDEPYYYTAASE
ncbi:hypothetical protein A6A08_12935 [Nocardiopsis sp. TSRI0078]|uniref:STM4015 family protein n=1 Tax=unclassified Nocardiopsis TaxID=2649073 RepID=UPI00093B3664|nr:STM4015 family protein [Nocardiopsis sp. TSRI0078]OKI14477.1 hypothetical protein A6A08_12935 [Nocardiopsis sp. TSRI0078]